VSAPSLNTFKGRLDKYWYSLDPSVFVRSSEQPKGQSGLTSKAEEEGFKVSNRSKMRLYNTQATSSHYW